MTKFTKALATIVVYGGTLTAATVFMWTYAAPELYAPAGTLGRVIFITGWAAILIALSIVLVETLEDILL